jgi:hypothetical protein
VARLGLSADLTADLAAVPAVQSLSLSLSRCVCVRACVRACAGAVPAVQCDVHSSADCDIRRGRPGEPIRRTDVAVVNSITIAMVCLLQASR